MSLRDTIQQVQARIEAARQRSPRSAAQVTLVAVTKTVPVDRIRDALNTGAITQLGENRVQEAEPKITTLQSAYPDLTWHMIGHLQTNKAKLAVTLFDMLHSVDSLRLAREIDKRARQQHKVMPVLFEINVSGETSKYGLTPDEVLPVIREAAHFDGLTLKGLMTMAPFVAAPEETRPYFRKLRELRDSVRQQGFESLEYLSMGMTNDFEVAVEEGANLVRIGSAIFGAR
jgi:PLP dependent protein